MITKAWRPCGDELSFFIGVVVAVDHVIYQTARTFNIFKTDNEPIVNRWWFIIKLLGLDCVLFVPQE